MWAPGACRLVVVAGGPVSWTEGSSPSLCRCPQGAQGATLVCLPGPGLLMLSRVVGLLLRSGHVPTCCVGPAETHPRPPKPDPVKSVSGVLSGLTPAKSAPVINNGSPTILGKRSYEQHNGVDGESGGPRARPVWLWAWGAWCPLRPRPLTVCSLLSPAAGRCQAT